MKYRYRARFQASVLVELETNQDDFIIEDQVARMLRENKGFIPGFELNILGIDVDYDSIKALENQQ